MFYNGKATILGIKTEAQIERVCQYYCNLLECTGFDDPVIQTVTGCFRTSGRVDLVKLKREDRKNEVSYEPELINSAIVSRDGMKFSVWYTGVVICAGGKSERQVISSCAEFVKILEEQYLRTQTPQPCKHS